MRIIISLDGDGNVFDVTGLPEDAEVEVRDYGVPDYLELGEYELDTMGDRYQGYRLHVRRTTGELEG